MGVVSLTNNLAHQDATDRLVWKLECMEEHDCMSLFRQPVTHTLSTETGT